MTEQMDRIKEARKAYNFMLMIGFHPLDMEEWKAIPAEADGHIYPETAAAECGFHIGADVGSLEAMKRMKKPVKAATSTGM